MIDLNHPEVQAAISAVFAAHPELLTEHFDARVAQAQAGLEIAKAAVVTAQAEVDEATAVRNSVNPPAEVETPAEEATDTTTEAQG